MAETLRDLVVSLSLNTDNFTRNIRSVQRQIQEAQSEFQLAASGIRNFEQTTEGLTAKLTSLERTLFLQADAVNQYEKALTAARDKLQECYDRQNDYAQRLQEARQKQADLSEQVQRAQAAYDSYKSTLGETDSATIAAKQNLDALKDEYRQASDEVKKLEGQNEALKKSTQNAADAVSAANVKLNQANAAMRTTQAAIAQTNQELALAQTQWNSAGAAMDTAKAALTTIGKQMQQAESRFKLATAGIKDMDTSVEGLSAKMTLLQEKITLQEQAVAQYEAALEATKQQLEAARQANDPEKVRQASNAVIDAQTSLNNARAALAQLRAQLAQTNQQLQTARSAWTQAGRSLTEFGDRCTKAGQTMTRMGKTLSMAVTTPITTLGTTAVKASMEFESAFTDVRKVTNASEAEFAELSDSIKQMSTELAASTTEIAGVVTSASRLGIQTDKLMDFTRVMIDLGNSTDMTANDAATSIARFANIMGMSADQYGNLGSTLVALGNNYATTESEIMEMSLRLAGAGKQVGLSEAQVLAFSAALSAVGIEAQMGGSSLSKALIKMEVAAATGGDALKDFATVCGMTQEQFKALWAVDPAAVFQSFITGLAQMDDAGISAIAVLDEIGISEIRLRDTLLRATNATELFSNTQNTANAAWKSGTELATVAEQRYATTASKLTNLKNSALLFAQTIGDDLNPTVHRLIEGTGEVIDKLMALDSTQRIQIIRWAAVAAAIGPVILVTGKVTKSIGTVSKGLGTFATAVGKAGGGFKGFMSVLTKSPAFWFAVAAATIAATAAIIDYASGAKQAREALEGMKKTAEDWKNTAAETFYGRSNGGLSFFGMSTDDFRKESAHSIQAANDWYTGLIAVWTDGKRETNAIVRDWTDSWMQLTASTREGLAGLKENADANGYTGLSAQIQADMDTLDAMDKEIAALLKKRQSKYFTEEDQRRLQELIAARGDIEIKYHLVEADTGGFDTIRDKMAAEVARARARGQIDADVTVYQNAITAAGQGMAAVNAQIDAQYDKEYALIQLIEDSTERQAAMDDLNARYLEQRRQAVQEYGETLAGFVMPVWNSESMKTAGDQMDRIVQLMRQYHLADDSEKPGILTQMEALTSKMDEGTLVEYYGLLTQIQSLLDSGMTGAEVQALFPEIDFSAALEQLASIQTFLSTRQTELPGLASMFGEALPEEVLTIATDLDLTGAQARWAEFAANPGAITTDAVIQSYSEAENAAKQQPTVDAFVAKYTEIADGADKSALTPTGLLAYVTTYAEATTGTDVSALTPENITAMVSAYNELATGADVSTLTPDEITAYVVQYLEKEGVDTSALTPAAVTAFVMAYEEVTGGASTTALTPSDITAMVVKYAEAESVDISALSPDQVEAIISSFAEATGCDKSTLMQDFTAYIARYDDTNAVKPRLTVSVGLLGYDLAAYRRFVANNPIEVQGILKLGEVYDDPAQALADTQTRFWKDGVEIPASTVPAELLTADKVAVLANDGTLHVLVTPEVTGDPDAVKTAAQPLTEQKVPVQVFGSYSTHDWGWLNDLIGSDVFDRMSWLTTDLDIYAKNVKGTWKDWRLIGSNVGDYNNRISREFDPDTVASLQTYVAEMVTAIQNGQEVSEEDLAHLQTVINFLSSMEASGTGESFIAGMTDTLNAAGITTSAETLVSDLQSALDTALQGADFSASGEQVSAGVGEGMRNADMSEPAEAMAGSTEEATNQAFDINSPSRRMMPTGEQAAAGIAEGMKGFSFEPAAGTVSGNAVSSLNAVLNSATLRPAGLNAMLGLRNGILAGRSSVISAMRSAARSAVNAAKSELKIHSPSRVFEDEVGVMTMRGLGKGVLKESKAQAKIIRNASRFLTGEAREGTIVAGNTTNTHTYHQDSSVNFTGSTFYIRDEKDVQALAVEIATLTRRRQHGRGLKMA